MARKPRPEIFTMSAILKIAAKQPLNRCRNLSRRSAIARGSTHTRVFADGSAHGEVERVDHLALMLHLFAFEADVGDPVLAAAVRAAGYVELDLLIESGQALFHLFDQPFCEPFRFADCQLAELGSRAGYGAAPELGALDAQPDLMDFVDQLARFFAADVHEDQILHDGCAQLAAVYSVLFGKLGSGRKLLAGDAPAQHRSTDVAQPRLLLRVDSGMVAQAIRRKLFGGTGIEAVSQPCLQLFEKALCSPALAHEEILEAGTVAIL